MIISGKTLLFASLSSLAIGGPLLAMSGFSFFASITLLLITSPLRFIFSPLLLGAGAVLVAAVAGFGVAAAAALTGLAAFGWISSELGVGRRFSGLIGAYGSRRKATENREEREGKELGEYFWQSG